MKNLVKMLFLGLTFVSVSVTCLAVLNADEKTAQRALSSKGKLHENNYTAGGTIPASQVYVSCGACNWASQQNRPAAGCPHNAKAIRQYVQNNPQSIVTLRAEEKAKHMDTLIAKVTAYGKKYDELRKKPSVSDDAVKGLEALRVWAMEFCMQYNLEWPTSICPQPSDLHNFERC